jgi:hypothetical protein
MVFIDGNIRTSLEMERKRHGLEHINEYCVKKFGVLFETD